jgi:hypothetical protein
MNRNNIRYQISLQRTQLSSTGKLNLSQPQPEFPPLQIHSLSDLGKQKHLKSLDISKTPITGLKSLDPQPVLEEIIAKDCPIVSYAGLGGHPRLRSLSLESTPLASRPNFRLSCCIVAGPHLTSINGKGVTASERTAAGEYPLLARYLIEAGWEVEVPPPPLAKLIQLASEKKVKLKGIDAGFTSVEAQKYLRAAPALVSVKVKGEAEGEAPVETGEEQNAELVNGICAKLAAIGFHVKHDEASVLSTIERLATILQELNTVSELPKLLGVDFTPSQVREPVQEEDEEEDS